MTTKISSWGNSYGVRLPKGIISEAGLEDGSELTLILQSDGTILLEPIERIPSLKDLLKIADKSTRHPEYWTDKPQGKEVW